jgi:cellulose synthase operon protein C
MGSRADSSRPVEALAAPGKGGSARVTIPRSDPEQVDLQLSVTKRGLGLELAHAVQWGPLCIEELSTTFPNLQFPLDLSGGVSKFRHRRSRLTRLALSFHRFNLERECSSSLQHWLTPSPPQTSSTPGFTARNRPFITLLPHSAGLTVGVHQGATALAFEVLWAPQGADVRLLVTQARSHGLSGSAQAMAVHVLEQALHPWGKRRGSTILIENLPGLVGRELLPLAGARAASVGNMSWGSVASDAHTLRLFASADQPAAELSPEATLALELASLSEPADEALIAGDLEQARLLYLRVLERAPYHPEIIRKIVDIDRIHERYEAGLSMLVSSTSAIDGGSLGAAMLRAVGDLEGARVALERAASTEVFSPLAAMLLAEAAECSETPGERAALLAAATVRSPTAGWIRWQKLRNSLELGDIHSAMAEAEALEAGVLGADERYRVLIESGNLLANAGHFSQARALFERALRYQPDGEQALFGLGKGLAHTGSAARAAEVFARAIRLAEQHNRTAYEARVGLAEVLGGMLEDYPTAIARLRGIPAGQPQSAQARWLEGLYLKRLGDNAAASLAFSRLRECIEHQGWRQSNAADWLFQAACFERDDRGDWEAAKRHMGTAIRLQPKNRTLLAEFRNIAREADRIRREPLPFHIPEQVSPPTPEGSPVHLEEQGEEQPPHSEEQAQDWSEAVPEQETHPLPESRGQEPATSTAHLAGLWLEEEDVSQEQQGTDDSASREDDEQKVERLTAMVRANPNDLSATLELAEVLERMGQDMELFALLSARLEEGDEETRSKLRPLQAGVLTRMANQAREQGRDLEAQLYEQALEAL